MLWKQLVIDEKLDKKIEELKQKLGYSAKWRVIEKALELLEEHITPNPQRLVLKVKYAFEEEKLKVPSNLPALIKILFFLLDDEELEEREKNEIIGQLILECQKKMKEVKENKRIEMNGMVGE